METIICNTSNAAEAIANWKSTTKCPPGDQQGVVKYITRVFNKLDCDGQFNFTVECENDAWSCQFYSFIPDNWRKTQGR